MRTWEIAGALLVALYLLAGCGTPARPLGPYTMPHVSGRTGMPPAPPTYGCRPTRTYPTPIAGECV